MAKGKIYGFHRVGLQGLCVGCHRPFIGKGDRCQSCAQDLRKRKRRKPR
jgi:rRNA maturation endonuclease Nob1